jgi:hypothetical protein
VVLARTIRGILFIKGYRPALNGVHYPQCQPLMSAFRRAYERFLQAYLK